jgi:hypothetical protein
MNVNSMKQVFIRMIFVAFHFRAFVQSSITAVIVSNVIICVALGRFPPAILRHSSIQLSEGKRKGGEEVSEFPCFSEPHSPLHQTHGK